MNVSQRKHEFKIVCNHYFEIFKFNLVKIKQFNNIKEKIKVLCIKHRLFLILYIYEKVR